MGEAAGALGINLPVLLAQLVQFIILFGVLYLVAYKPILRILDERARKVKESMEQTELIKQQAERAGEETKKRIGEASKEGQELVARATRTGEETRRQAQEAAKQDAESLVARARLDIQLERDEAIGELRKEFADLTIMAAEKVIERSLDKKAHREIIDKVLEEGTTLGKG
ncbi:F0F1 ATP synthase subunit B [Chloroflexota bacterium]